MSVKVRLASTATAQIITIGIVVTVRQDTQEITARQVCTIYNPKQRHKDYVLQSFFFQIGSN